MQIYRLFSAHYTAEQALAYAELVDPYGSGALTADVGLDQQIGYWGETTGDPELEQEHWFFADEELDMDQVEVQGGLMEWVDEETGITYFSWVEYLGYGVNVGPGQFVLQGSS